VPKRNGSETLLDILESLGRERFRAQIKFWNPEKGLGFLKLLNAPHDARQLFFHVTDVISGQQYLAKLGWVDTATDIPAYAVEANWSYYNDGVKAIKVAIMEER
jgi:hypothetical protein